MADNFSIEYMHVDYIPFHISHNLQILYVLEGSIKITVVSGSVVLDKHNIDVLNINEPVEIQGLTKDNKVLMLTIKRPFCEIYYPNINLITFNCNFDHFYPGKPTKKVTKTFKQQVIEIILDDITKQKSSEVIDKQLVNLLQFMIIKLDDLRLAFQNDNALHDHFYRFQRITTQMIADSYAKFSLQDIAKQEYLDYHYLSHEFSMKLNTSFYENLHYFRIQSAVRLLLNSELSIRDISVTTGFSATRYFYKMFKKYLKCTPAEFRKRHKETVKQVTNLSLQNLEDALRSSIGIILNINQVDLTVESLKATPQLTELNKDCSESTNENGQDSFSDVIRLIQSFKSSAKLNLTLYDERDEKLFHGGSGLKTYNGLNKPIFYGYSFLKQLGCSLIYMDDSFIVTTHKDSFIILIFNPSPKYPLKKSINLILPNKQYRQTRFSLNPNSHDIKKQWNDMGSPHALDNMTIEMLNNNTYPKLTYSIIDQHELTLEGFLQPYGCEMVKLEVV